MHFLCSEPRTTNRNLEAHVSTPTGRDPFDGITPMYEAELAQADAVRLRGLPEFRLMFVKLRRNLFWSRSYENTRAQCLCWSLLRLICSSNTNTRMADERLADPLRRSIWAMRAPTVTPLASALSLTASQNASSRLMLVL